MRYLSVCSGVEAASVAWEHLGWTPVGFSEIEPFPSAVLKHRFPNVPNFGDMTKYKEWPIEPGTVDVLVGGTPCQSFSVAGLRKGLDDPRGNLMLVYLGLAEHFRIPWLVWENVPGVLSSNGGRDFGTFLGALGELGYRWSFRVLDAQYFGVPQRRRRVFVVAHLGDRGDPAKVLLEPESACRDHPKSRAKAEKIARGARPGAEVGGRPGPFWNGADVAEALTRTSDDQRMPDKGRMQVVVTQADVAGPLDAHYGKGPGSRQGGEREYVGVVTATGPVTHAVSAGSRQGTATVAVAFDTTQITSPKNYSSPKPGDPCHPLAAGAHPPAIAFAQNTRDEVRLIGGDGQTVGALAAQPGMKQTTYLATTNVTGTLSSRATAAGGLGTDFEVAGGLQAVGFDPTGSTANVGLDLSPTLRGSGVAGNAGHHAAAMTPTMAVRRLLPVECERLQGFPDNHTNIPWKGKPASECPDGPRYKAMGNSFAVPVVRWIGERLDAVAKGKRG